MLQTGSVVKVSTPADKLPSQAAMYAGQIGTVIGSETIATRTYYLVQFPNDDVAAYFNKERKKMCNFITEEKARALAGDCPVEGLSEVAVADAVAKAHESNWYQLAKLWAEQPLPIGGKTFPRACRFIVAVIDNEWNVARALLKQYSINVPFQIALLIETILLTKNSA